MVFIVPEGTRDIGYDGGYDERIPEDLADCSRTRDGPHACLG